MARRKNTLLKNVFANWTGLAVNMAVAFFMSPFLVHRLGDTWYGIWVLLLSLTGYMGLLDGGLKVSVVRYVSRHHAVNDRDGLNRVISTALALYAAVYAAVMTVSVAASPLLPSLFAIPASTHETARLVLLITSANLGLTLVVSVFNGILSGIQRYDISNRIGVVMVIVRSVAIVAVVLQGYGIVGLGLVQLAFQFVTGVLLAHSAFQQLPGLRVRPALVGWGTAKTLYGYSAFILLNNIAMFLLFHSAEVMAGALISAAAVTYCAIAGTLLQYLARLIGHATQVLHPHASAQEARGDTAGLRRTIVLGTKACVLTALPVTVTLMLVAEPFIRFWMGAAYAAVTAPLLVVMAAGRFFWLAQSAAGNVLLGVERHKLLTTTNVITGISGIALGAVMIRPLGLFGLALGITVPMIITQAIVLPRMVVRMFDIPAGQYWREAFVLPMLGCVPYALVLYGLLTLVAPGTLGQLAAIVALAAPAWLLPTAFICFSGRERRAVWNGSAAFVAGVKRVFA